MEDVNYKEKVQVGKDQEKLFSCKKLGLTLVLLCLELACKIFENRSADKVLMAKMNSEYGVCIGEGDYHQNKIIFMKLTYEKWRHTITKIYLV